MRDFLVCLDGMFWGDLRHLRPEELKSFTEEQKAKHPESELKKLDGRIGFLSKPIGIEALGNIKCGDEDAKVKGKGLESYFLPFHSGTESDQYLFPAPDLKVEVGSEHDALVVKIFDRSKVEIFDASKALTREAYEPGMTAYKYQMTAYQSSVY